MSWLLLVFLNWNTPQAQLSMSRFPDAGSCEAAAQRIAEKGSDRTTVYTTCLPDGGQVEAPAQPPPAPQEPQ